MANYQTLNRESVFWALMEQRLGFEFGQPTRVDQDSLAVVLPIVRRTSTPRIYKTYPEVDFVKVHDSGHIDTMIADNQGQEHVFIRSGTIFQGGTQERTSVRSTVVLTGEKANIKVRCVHASKGIRPGQQVKYNAVVPLEFERQVYSTGFTGADQSQYWAAAQNTNNQMLRLQATQNMGEGLRQARLPSRRGAAPSSSSLSTQSFYVDTLAQMGGLTGVRMDDLTSNFQDFSKNFDHVLAKVKMVQDQVGLGLITDKGVETVEIFDAHDSWKGMHQDAIKRLGPDLAKNDTSGVFDYKPEKAQEVVRSVLALPFQENLIYEHKPKNGDPHFRVLGLTADKYTGEVVEMDGKVIHLMVLRMGNN